MKLDTSWPPAQVVHQGTVWNVEQRSPTLFLLTGPGICYMTVNELRDLVPDLELADPVQQLQDHLEQMRQRQQTPQPEGAIDASSNRKEAPHGA